MPSETPALPLVYLFPAGVATDAGPTAALKWAPGEGPFGRSKAFAVNSAACVVSTRRKVFTPEECARVVAVGDSLPGQDGGVEKGENLYRVSRIAWIEPNDGTAWIFHRLALAIVEANRAYGFELVGFAEALQYTVYGPGQRFDWHMDLGPGHTSARKLSITLQLSGPDDYSGGALEFIGRPDAPERRALGSMTIFPSYVAHRVTPVESGIRRSLVAWAYGPSFR